MSAELDLDALRRCGDAYGRLGFAIAHTGATAGPAAKVARNWKGARAFVTPALGRVTLLRHPAQNPVLVLAASNVVGVDLDGPRGRELAAEYELDALTTVTVSTGNGTHLWFRPPPDCPPIRKVQLAADGVVTAADGYLCCPPSRHHPSGRVYAFLEGREPWTIPLATIPKATLERLARAGREHREVVRQADGPIERGSRHEHLRQVSWAMRRYSGASLEAIEAALIVENQARCAPPQPEYLVRELAEGTYRRVTPIGSER